MPGKYTQMKLLTLTAWYRRIIITGNIKMVDLKPIINSKGLL